MAARGSRQGIQGMTSGQNSKFTSLCSSRSLSKHIFNRQKTILHTVVFLQFRNMELLYSSLWVPIEKPPEQQLLPPCSRLVRSNFPGDLRQLPMQNGITMNILWITAIPIWLNGCFICLNSSENPSLSHPCLGVLHHLATNSSFMSHLKHIINI